MTRNAQILSTGSYVPERVVTNAEMEAILGEPVDEWLIENVGIRERRFMADDQTTSDLILAASQRALEKAGIGPEALDLGARYLMTEPGFRYVLVAGGYGMSRFLDLHDKRTATLFADGAGAAVLGVGEEPGFLASNFMAQGEYHDALGIYTGGAFRPCTPYNLEAYGPPRVQFVKKFPKTFNTEYWPKLIQGTLDKADLAPDDVDFYLFTQLNLRTIENMMALLGQPMEKTHWVMDKWGYTGSPCVVMALDDAIQHGRGPQKDQIVLFCTSGGGITMAASLWKWTAS